MVQLRVALLWPVAHAGPHGRRRFVVASAPHRPLSGQKESQPRRRAHNTVEVRGLPDGRYWGVNTRQRKPAVLLLAMLVAQSAASAKVIEDARYRVRVDLPGIVSDTVEESDAKHGPLVWRAYTSSSPAGQRDSYTAAVKVFDTDSPDPRVLFEAGESDASEALGASLIGRR